MGMPPIRPNFFGYCCINVAPGLAPSQDRAQDGER
jgi:hypothetical protein